MPSGQIFYYGGCEGQEYSKEVYLVDALALAVKKVADMNQVRAFPSLCYHKNYVFGGYTGTSIKEAEKFSIVKGNWD